MPQPVLTCASVVVQLLTNVDGEFDGAISCCYVSAAFRVLKKCKEKREKHRRLIWVREYLKSRKSRIMRDLEFNEDLLFKNFTLMFKTNFYTLLGVMERMITKQNNRFRESVPAENKLAITLRYLAIGDSFMPPMCLFKVSKQFVSSMIPGVPKAIFESLQDHIKVSFLFCMLSFE
jgi:hypothetical protein